MEDYIFLLIAIALSIFGAINKKKKKNDEVNPFAEKEEKPKNFFMDQLLDDDFFAETVEEEKPVVKVKPVLKRDPIVLPASHNQSGYFHSEFKSTLPDRTKRTIQSSVKKSAIEVEDVENETDDSPGYLEDFSLRKAFVYSEIMTRKY
jgi:hypothetical protein